MNPDVIAGTGSTVVLISLYTASHFFNRWVDQRHIDGERSDGEVARWVVFGCTYSLVGGAALMALWSHRMPTDWLVGLWSFGVFLLALGASGLPMIFGDVNRSHAQRLLRQARKDWHNATGKNRTN